MGRTALGWVLVAIFSLGAATACAAAAKKRGEERDVVRRVAYVDSVLAPARIRAGAVLDVIISGTMPDPSWTLDKADVQQKDGKVRIIPWTKRLHTEPTVQMLVSFAQQVEVKGLTPGHWEVEVEGFGDEISTTAVEVLP
jgi:hypothetical protein